KGIISLALFMLIALAGFSCNVSFWINGKEKFDKNRVYKVGEEIQIKILVDFIHQPCQIGMNETKLKLDGLEIVKQGEWIKSDQTNGYYMDMVVKIKPDYAKDGKLILTRTCTNEGGFGMLKFKHN
ncbi:MAG: hypothetical protein WCR29_07675, partial [Bacteroidales bacterium]